MQTALRTTTKVLRGGRVQIVAPQLPANELVEVIIVFPVGHDDTESVPKRSALEILRDLPGHRLFQTAAEVDAYLTGERDTWDN